MVEIELTQGKYALIDEEDYDKVKEHSWCAEKHPKTFYAVTSRKKIDGGPGTIAMHRFLLGVTDPKVLVDHVDGDGLDNRRKNIRIATQQQNQANCGLRANNKSGFKGVSWNKKNENWWSFITVKGKPKYLGSFDSPDKASEAYEKAAIELHGEFARVT